MVSGQQRTNPNAGGAVPAYEQIRNLLARYAFLLDSADYPKWGALFGDEGRLELNGKVWATGADQIAKTMAGFMEKTRNPVRGFKGSHMYRHVLTNIHIDVDEVAGTAEADSYFFVVHVEHDGPPAMRGGGRYRDSFARSGDDWRFVAKRIEFDWNDVA